MIKLHYLENSRAQRILWLLEELALDYEVVPYKRDAKTQLAPPELKALHPLGKSPVLEDNGKLYAESGAIVEYLVDTYGKGEWKPSQEDADAYRDYVFWMHFAEGSLMPPLVMNVIFETIKNPPVPFFIKPVMKTIGGLIAKEVNNGYIEPTLLAMLDYLEERLTAQRWLLGENISGADIMVSFGLEGLVAKWPQITRYPHICTYVARFQTREAYQQALDRGMPYDIIEPEH